MSAVAAAASVCTYNYVYVHMYADERMDHGCSEEEESGRIVGKGGVVMSAHLLTEVGLCQEGRGGNKHVFLHTKHTSLRRFLSVRVSGKCDDLRGRVFRSLFFSFFLWFADVSLDRSRVVAQALN